MASHSDDEFEFTCSHENLIEERGIFLCRDCGEEQTELATQASSVADASRIQMRKVEETGIFKDVESMKFNEKIVMMANKIYMDVTKGKIFRGKSRKAIIFACIFHAFKAYGKIQTHEKLLKQFELTKKLGLRGLNKVNLQIPKNSPLRETSITPVNLIEEIMDNFSSSPEQKKEVISIYEKIKNKSSVLNRSRPQSVASGIVFYWIIENKKSITIDDFKQKVSPSSSTILKMSKEIKNILLNLKQ